MSDSKILAVVAVVIIVIIAAVGAVLLMGGEDGGEETITQKGSDTLLELMQNCAERFHENHTDTAVEVTGGGSGTGIAALIAGEVDVAQASRGMKQSEKDQLPDWVEFKVAIDGIAIIVHEDNSISELTVEQLGGIYNGTYTNWNQVGGADMNIVAYGRQSTSGTYAFFQEQILNEEDYRADMQQMAGNAAIVDSVKLDEAGIGYVGIGYAQSATGIEIVELAEEAGGTYYSPLDADAVYSGDYVLARYLFLYTDGAPTDIQLIWISWILSPEGQAIVGETGFYPLSSVVIAEEVAKLGY
jgi:phosphate transport system substrate-binding protein